MANYVALSHCWGPEPPLKTTSKNRRQMERDLSWSFLPKTFQDAILVTLHLGMQYIWIDSLCIIQDDALDWDRESARMCNCHTCRY